MFCCEKRKGGLVCRGKKLPLNSVPRLLASGGTTRLRCDFGLGVLRVSPLHTQLFLGSLEKMTDQWKEEKVDDWGIWWRLVGLKGIEIWNSEMGMVQYCVCFQMIWHTSGWFLILYVFIFDYKPPTAVAGFLVSLKIKFSPTHDPKTKSSQSSHNFVIVAGYICNPRLREGGYCMFWGYYGIFKGHPFLGIFATQFGGADPSWPACFFRLGCWTNTHPYITHIYLHLA